jgi:ATP-dependent Clp protease adaptor protein ClpS
MSDVESAAQSVIAVLPAPREHTFAKRAPPVAKREPNYHVIIWNDNEHSPQYVIEMLTRLFHHSAAQAYDITWRIDRLGKAVAATCHRELAELKRELIENYGADSSLPDAQPVSMRATLEPAPE